MKKCVQRTQSNVSPAILFVCRCDAPAVPVKKDIMGRQVSTPRSVKRLTSLPAARLRRRGEVPVSGIFSERTLVSLARTPFLPRALPNVRVPLHHGGGRLPARETNCLIGWIRGDPPCYGCSKLYTMGWARSASAGPFLALFRPIGNCCEMNEQVRPACCGTKQAPKPVDPSFPASLGPPLSRALIFPRE